MHWLNRLIGEPEDSVQVPGNRRKLHCRTAGHRDTLLFLFFHSPFYWLYQCRAASERDLFFLISSPMVDLGSLVLLMSIFGWKVAVIYVFLGLLVAVLGGSLIGKLKLEDEVEEFIRRGNVIDAASESMHFRDRIRYVREQVISTARKVFPYVLAGVGIGAVIHNWIPETFIVELLGTGNPFGVIIATVAGVPMYANIFGTIPIAQALLAKGARLGVVLSFMMGVTTLSLPSIIMLRKAVKPKLLAVFVAICTVGIILIGYFFNTIQHFII